MNTKNHQTRIVIYIIIGAVIAAVGIFLVLHSNNSQSGISLQDKLDLGHKYLVELSYDKAVLEFTDAIEIDPMNADSYLGLADAYIGQGDTDKAVEVLEKGFDKTGDDRIKEKLDELKPAEETTVTTVSETTAETTVVTYELAVVPNLVGLTEEEASQLIKDAGLKGKVKNEFNETVEKGYVISQMIPADAEVGKNTNVIYSVSKGKEPVAISETTAATTSTEKFVTIKGKQYSTNLTELNLRKLNLTDEDIKSLSEFTNLTNLDLSYNEISDISTLSKLTSLTKLDLSENKISDISSLSNLNNLSELWLSANQINDISSISKLTNLTKLILSGNKISNIDSLSDLTELTKLWLSSNKISDISPLSDLTNLTELGVSFNQVSNTSALSNLKNIRILDLSGNQISDIRSLKGLRNLTSLRLCGNQIDDIKVLSNLTNLTELDLMRMITRTFLENDEIVLVSDFYDNPIKEEDIKKLQEALPKCKITY